MFANQAESSLFVEPGTKMPCLRIFLLARLGQQHLWDLHCTLV
jgi:hypothetical protein